MNTSLYQLISTRGYKISNKKSDLYVEFSEEVNSLVKNFESENDIKVFTRIEIIENESWLVIPFYYEPYYQTTISKDQSKWDLYSTALMSTINGFLLVYIWKNIMNHYMITESVDIRPLSHSGYEELDLLKREKKLSHIEVLNSIVY